MKSKFWQSALCAAGLAAAMAAPALAAVVTFENQPLAASTRQLNPTLKGVSHSP